MYLIKPKEQTMDGINNYKILINNVTELPTIYSSYDLAKSELKNICSKNIATYGRVIYCDGKS